MAFGDSITAGVNASGRIPRDGGYRGPLARLLARTGYRASFVGSRRGFWLGGTAHEAWPGYVLRSFPSDPGPGQLYGKLARTAMEAHDPDIVLLMAGTNDLLRYEDRAAGYTLANILASMDLLIGQIVTAKPYAFVIVAPVVASPKIDVLTLGAFHDGLHGLAAAYGMRSGRVSFAAEMATSVPRDAVHFPDGIHPWGGSGYRAIADVWLRAIEALARSQTSAPSNRVSRFLG